MVIPMRLHSLTNTEIFSVLLISFESRPAMNFTGWFAFKYAVS